MKKKKKKKNEDQKRWTKKRWSLSKLHLSIGSVIKSIYSQLDKKRKKKLIKTCFPFFFLLFFLLGRGSLRSFESLHFLFKIFLIEAWINHLQKKQTSAMYLLICQHVVCLDHPVFFFFFFLQNRGFLNWFIESLIRKKKGGIKLGHGWWMSLSLMWDVAWRYVCQNQIYQTRSD